MGNLTKKISYASEQTISERALEELLNGLKDDVQLIINAKLDAIINDYDYNDLDDMKNYIEHIAKFEIEEEIIEIFK